jgi:hypothetical protein
MAYLEGRFKSDIIEAMQKVAEPRGFGGEQLGENFFAILLCNTAYMEVNFEGEAVTLYLQGTPTGPGAHAAGIDFMEALEEKTGLVFSVDDQTEYFETRDFKALQAKYAAWLQNVVTFARDRMQKEPGGTIAAGWAPDWYRPTVKPGSLLTHMGVFAVGELVAWTMEAGIEPFAREFFLWYNKDRDGLFHRNNAIALLWKECMFMSSGRSSRDRGVNGAIIEWLEAAAKMDPALPFPKEEYREVCTLAEHKPIKTDHLSSYDLFDVIGYRRGNVTYFIANQNMTLPGYFIEGRSRDGKALVFFDANNGLDWHRITIWPRSLEGAFEGFDEAFFSGSVGELEDFDFPDGGKGRIAYKGLEKNESGGKEYVVRAELVSPNHENFIAIAFGKESEKDWAVDLIYSMRVQELDIIKSAENGEDRQ